MVDVVATNEKLRERVRRIVSDGDRRAERGDRRARSRRPTADAKVAIVTLLARRGRGVRARAARGRGRQRARGARPVKLDVEAALVDGLLVPGRRRDRRRRDRRRRPERRTDAASPSPGFVDLQVNGFGGVDFLEADADGYRRAGEALLETGVTALPADADHRAGGRARRGARGDPDERRRHRRAHPRRPPRGPVPLAQRASARIRPSARRDPDPALLERLLAAGPVRIMTLAPELPGALELIDLLRRARRHRLAAATPMRSAEQANARLRPRRPHGHASLQRDAAVPAPRPRHRRRGARARRRDRADHRRRHPPRARDGVSSSGSAAAGRVALVTDAVAPARAAATARTASASLEVGVRDGAVRGPDGVLAGSVLTMIDAVRNLHALGVPLAAALAAATAVPARVLGPADVGRLDVGLPADVVVLGRQPRCRARARGRRGACRLLRPTVPSRPRPAQAFLAEIHEQPRALSSACSSTRTSTRASPPPRASADDLVRMVGHGSSDNAAAYGIYAFGLLPRLDRAARLDHAERLLRRRARHVGLDRDRALAVGPHAGRRRLRRAGAAPPAPSPSR